MSIDVQTAVAAAKKFLGEVYEGHAQEMRFEELELPDEMSSTPLWRVTFSFIDDREPPRYPMGGTLGELGQLINPSRNRQYKTAELDRHGRPLRVVIRRVE